ncbi:MAG: dolichyl-phosphate-mannose--protein mannosyltransferase [Nitrospirales bacterium]|nr:MAG: dolichyl-phosphate-mannose--protein mannosyltransferase [Nitrospirales bacterium]
MSNRSLSYDQFSNSSFRNILAIFVLASLLLLVNLGELGLTDRDEGSNAEAAREMLETGDWVSPTLNYEPRFAKPAFVYWIISASYAVFGVNEFSARLPSALFGIGLILLQYGFLAKVGGTRIATLGALMLLLNLEMIGVCRMVLTDPELVFFTTLAGYSFWLGMESEQSKRWVFLALYVGMACAMLAKGPVGIIIPLLGVIPYLSLTGQWKSYWQKGYPLLGLLVVGLIAAPWYLAMFTIHGEAYIAAAQANTTGRFANPMEGHGGTILFYIPVLFLGFFPWSAFLPMPLYYTLKGITSFRTIAHDGSSEQRLAIFSALWIVGLLIFFTLSATRLPHYIFPLFPASAILVALYWNRCLKEPSPPGLTTSKRLLITIGYALGLTLAAAPAVYTTFIEKITKEFPAAGHMEVQVIPVFLGFLVILGTMGLRYFLASKETRLYGFGVAGGMMVVLVFVVVVFALPKFHVYFIAPPQQLASLAGLNLKPEDRLIQFGRKRPSLVFYAQRKVYQINPGEDHKFEPHENVSGQKAIILQSHLRPQLPEPASDYQLMQELNGFSLLVSPPLQER